MEGLNATTEMMCVICRLPCIINLHRQH